MNLNKFIPTAVSTRVARTILLTQKNSPQILFVTGVAGAVTATVLACRSTLKAPAIIDEHKKKSLDIKTVVADYSHKYSDQDRRHDTTLLYVQTVVKLTKLYGPSLLLGVASVAALTGSNRILNTRNAALTAAYGAVEKAYAEYRGRVIEKYGEEQDREFRYASETREIAVDTKKGTKIEHVTHVDGEGKHGPYSKMFSPTNQNWDERPEYNMMFLRTAQNWLNDKLRARGHVTLNDAYDQLGMERTSAGQVVGWVWGSDEGDNYIDFGIFTDRNMNQFYDFMRGRNDSILLDFNVDGVVYDLIDKLNKRVDVPHRSQLGGKK